MIHHIYPNTGAMVKTLRKRHLQVWITLAVLIPAGMLAAVVTRAPPAIGKLLQVHTSAGLPVLLKTVDKKNYTANLRCNADTSSLQLEWINKKAIAVPSELVYQVADVGQFGHKGGFFIGRIASVGTYYFALEKAPPLDVNIMVYDIVKHLPVDSIQFSK